MTDYEIIKNLEACKKGNCTGCSLNCIKSEACITLLCSYAFELINCQQAEIEGLEKAKSEAIKEFAERLKKEAFECDVSFGYGKECYTEAVTTIEIDRLTKEMTEGGNG